MGQPPPSFPCLPAHAQHAALFHPHTLSECPNIHDHHLFDFQLVASDYTDCLLPYTSLSYTSSQKAGHNACHLQIHHINFLDLAKQAFGFNSKQPFYIGFEKFTIFAQNKGCCTHLMKCNENAFGEEENDDDANKLEKEES